MEYFFTTAIQEAENIKSHELKDMDILEILEQEEFIIIDRENPAHKSVQNYMQVTLGTYYDKLFLLESRQYHSDNSDDFSHYRLLCDELEPVENAFTAFFNETADYENWEDVTAEFK